MNEWKIMKKMKKNNEMKENEIIIMTKMKRNESNDNEK